MCACCSKLTVHSGRFRVVLLCVAPRTPDGCPSAVACRGASAAPAGAWTLVRGREWRHLQRGCPPIHPQGLFCHSGPPVAAGSSCTRPEAAGHQGAEADSLWGGAGAARPFLPSEPGVRRDIDWDGFVFTRKENGIKGQRHSAREFNLLALPYLEGRLQ